MSDRAANESCVVIVSFESGEDLGDCLRRTRALSPAPKEIVVVDNASRDSSVAVARAESRRQGPPIEILEQGRNLGFAAAMNLGIAATSAPWILALNPDARPAPDYVSQLLDRAARHSDLSIGALTGKLVRPAAPGGSGRVLDACGMHLTRTWRHLDRGSGEPDRGQYPRAERVFGATGAALLLRRRALLDVAIEGEIFDVRFHSYREDAELAFRFQERGWEVVFDPAARCEHRRFNLPSRRGAMPPGVNRHSLKNRYLLRIYHQTRGNLLRTLPWTLVRDVGALTWVIMRERSSWAAYTWLWRHRAELRNRRRLIQARRTASRGALERWFRCRKIPLPSESP